LNLDNAGQVNGDAALRRMCERTDVLICGQHRPGRPAEMELLVFSIDAVQAECIYGPVKHAAHSRCGRETVSLVDTVEVHSNRDFAATVNMDVMLVFDPAVAQEMAMIEFVVTIFNKKCAFEVLGESELLRLDNDIADGGIFGNGNDLLVGVPAP